MLLVKVLNVCGWRNFSSLRHTRCFTSVSGKNIYSSLLYQLPYIKAASLLNRMKAYQTAMSATATAASVALNLFNIIPNSTLYAVLYLGFASCLPFYTIGILCNNLIGKIYLSNDMKTVKIAHITFWGRRKDTVIEVNDILPLSEIRGKPYDVYFNIERYSQQSPLKLSLRFGKIENKDLFIKTFGQINIT